MSRYQEYLIVHFKKHYDELRRFLTAKLRCADDAAEVVQEAYVRLLSLPEAAAIHHPRAFLFKTAFNLAVDKLRHPYCRTAQTARTEVLAELPSPAPSPEAIVTSRERLQVLRQAIGELPPRCRQVFVLHKLANLTHKEIATRLGISPNMIEKHIIKAMTYCRHRLDELTEP